MKLSTTRRFTRPQVDALAEVEERAERPALAARAQDRLDRALAHVLDAPARPKRMSPDALADSRSRR